MWANLSKLNTIANASIAKVNTIANASILAINGAPEDLTTFTETDPSGWVTVTSNQVSFAGMQRTPVTTVYKDYTASYFGNFVVNFETEITASATDALAIVCAISNINNAGYGGLIGQDACACWFDNSGGNLSAIIQQYNPNSTDSFSIGAAIHGHRYNTFMRSGTTLTWNIYTDPGRTTLEDSLTVTGTTTRYRYMNALGNRGAAGTAAITGYTKNFVIISRG